VKRLTRSLYARTALTLALAFVVFQAAAFWVVTRTLIVPVAERSADDLAGLIVLSAQTWVELPPQTRRRERAWRAVRSAPDGRCSGRQAPASPAPGNRGR
jgi:hypothetical protein